MYISCHRHNSIRSSAIGKVPSASSPLAADMKSVTLFTVILISAVNLSLQIAELKDCPPDFDLGRPIADICSVITCDGPNSFSEMGCPTWMCMPGKQIGYEEANNSRIYPDCCDGPICAD